MPRKYTKKPSKTHPAHAIWIVVADAGRARLFQAEKQDGVLTEIADLINADVRMQEHDVVSDRTGHVNRGSDGVGNSFDPHQWRVDHLAETFAKSLCKRLSSGRRAGAVDRIYLVADPAFLGMLRNNLDRPTQRIVAQEKAKDLTRLTPKAIRAALPAVL